MPEISTAQIEYIIATLSVLIDQSKNIDELDDPIGDINPATDSIHVWSDADSKGVKRPIEDIINIVPAPDSNQYYDVLNISSEALSLTTGSYTTDSEIVSAINQVGFNIGINQLKRIKVAVYIEDDNNTLIQHNYYDFKKNNVLGTWGTSSDNGEISIEHLIINERILSDFQFTSPATSEFIVLGDIRNETISEYINNIDPATIDWENLLDDGTTYYFTCIQNDISKFYQYVGTLPITLGSGNTPVAEIDFDLLDFSTSPPPTIYEDEVVGRAEFSSTGGLPTITLDIDGWSHKDYRIVNDTDLTFPDPPIGRSYVRNMIVYNSAGPELTIIEGAGQTLRVVGEYDNTVHVRNLLTIEASNTSTDGINITVYVNHETI